MIMFYNKNNVSVTPAVGKICAGGLLGHARRCLLGKQGGRLGRNGGDASRGPGVAPVRRHEAGLQKFSCRHNGKGIKAAVDLASK